MADIDTLRELAGSLKRHCCNCGPHCSAERAHDVDDECVEASAAILALLEENERLRKALAWIDNADPEIVTAAEEKFGFKLFPAHP